MTIPTRHKLIFAALGLLLLGIAPGVAVARSTGSFLADRPEPYTELYFRNIPSLPVHLAPKQAVTVTFKVANHENSAKVYPYTASVIENGQRRVVKAGYVTLVSEQAANIPVTYTAAGAGHSVELIIELPNQQQTIHFRSQS